MYVFIFEKVAKGDGTHDIKQLVAVFVYAKELDFLEKITVFDSRENVVGKTYVRRAKQLVIKGRAHWSDDGRAIILADDDEDFEMEETNMDIPNTNGKLADYGVRPAPEPPPAEADNELLMYIARRNVREKRNLFWHIIAMPVVLIISWILTDGFHFRGPISADFAAGVYFVWSIVVAHKIWGRMRAWMRNRGYRRDPLAAEYERLRHMDPRAIRNEMK